MELPQYPNLAAWEIHTIKNFLYQIMGELLRKRSHQFLHHFTAVRFVAFCALNLEKFFEMFTSRFFLILSFLGRFILLFLFSHWRGVPFIREVGASDKALAHFLCYVQIHCLVHVPLSTHARNCSSEVWRRADG